MRFSLPLLFAIAAAGCASPENDAVVSTEPTVVPADPAIASTEPAADPTAQVVYQCESGQTIQASYPTTDTATVEYEGQTLPMTIAVSGSGSRYVGDELEWWTQGSGPGSEGTLFRHNSDGTSGEMVEQCEVSA